MRAYHQGKSRASGPLRARTYPGCVHLLRYTLLRVALLLGSVGALYLLGMRSWLLWGAGILVAALLSYVLLPRQRDKAALDIARSVERRRTGTHQDADADYEDAVIDESTPQPQAHPTDDARPGGDGEPGTAGR